MSWQNRAEEVKDDWKSRAEDADIENQGPLETFAETALDELTLGYYPQIAAGIKSQIDDVDYAKQRDIERSQLQTGQMESPIASGLGTGAAILGQMAVPMGGALKMASLAKAGAPLAKEAAKQVVKNMAVGSAISGLKNPGDVRGAVTPMQLDKRLENITSEAPLNAITSVAGGLIDAKVAKKAADAPVNLIKALRPIPTKATVLLANKAKRAKEVGNFIFENGIVKPGYDSGTILEKAESKVNEIGNILGNFIKRNSDKIEKNKSLDDFINKTTLDLDRDIIHLSDIIEQELLKNNYSGGKDVADVVTNQVMKDYDTLKEFFPRQEGKTGTFMFNLESMNKMKRFMQDQVSSYDKMFDTTKDAGALSEGFDIAANYFRDKVEEEISKFGTDEISKQLKALNKAYSLASDARGLATRHNVREFLKQDSLAPIIGGTSAGGLTYGITKDPALSMIVGTGAGALTGAVQRVSPTSKAAISTKLPEVASRNIIPKSSAYYSAQESTPVFDLDKVLEDAINYGIPPHIIDQQIRDSKSLPPTEKARLRIQNQKGGQ